MKILIDMNLSPKWADYLIKNGIEAVHWSIIGYHDASDAEIFSYAKEHDFTILTSDLDFGFILAFTHRKKPSVIQTRTDILNPNIIGGIVISAIKQFSADIDQGALITIDLRKTRVSILPLL
jgi:predicted nuclease of predicted toxin-antitoxin system